MINRDLIEIFSELAREKNVERSELGTILEQLFLYIIERTYGDSSNFSVIVNIDKGEIEIYAEKIVVKNVENSMQEITAEDALQKELARMEGHYKKGKTKLQWEKIQRIKDEIKSYDQQKTYGGDETTTTKTTTDTSSGAGDGNQTYTPPPEPGTTGSWTPAGTYTAPTKQSPSDAPGTPFAHGGRVPFFYGGLATVL